MAADKKTTVVAGDVAIDWFTYPVEVKYTGANWQMKSVFRSSPLRGGALLLADFLRESLAHDGVTSDLAAPAPSRNLELISPEDIIHSNAVLRHYKVEKEWKLRVERGLGYMGPEMRETPLVLSPDPNFDKADVIVLDDAGNGFRYDKTSWPKALDGKNDPTVVCKMSRPLAQGSLWKYLTEKHFQKFLTIVHASDIRGVSGVHITKSLSWERTAKEFLFQIQRSEHLSPLQQCPYLVVMFGTDGAILFRAGDDAGATLIFDPLSREDGFADKTPGTVYGITSLFTATIATQLVKDGFSDLVPAIKRGLVRCRKLLKTGYVKENNSIACPLKEVLSLDDSHLCYAACPIERTEIVDHPDPNFWRILDDQTRNKRQKIAEQIVLKKEAEGLKGVPIGSFGKLETIDRAEIESYSAIRELIVDFLANPKPPRPLCFAIFGPPGAGKSFGVKQVLASIQSQDIETRTFNLSQFHNYHDLVVAFHEIRDIALEGKVPCVFFDEFDCEFEGKSLGWLRYFLAPMQDGEFKDVEAIHPIGKAIFVFAGGTKASFKVFSEDASKNTKEAKEAKGPDFISRLRGFINVMGPNRQDSANDDDEAFILRRSKMLRGLLQRNPKTDRLFDPEGILRIDEGVLRALLNVTRYVHGVRSMEAIIDMSRLVDKELFDLSALPPRELLEIHANADEFLMLTERERYQSILCLRDMPKFKGKTYRERENEIVETVAKQIHEHYVQQQPLAGKSSESTEPWERLAETYKISNLDAAEDIPHKLHVAGCGMRKFDPNREPRTPDWTDEEVQDLARLEHERWIRERRLQGYKYMEKMKTKR